MEVLPDSVLLSYIAPAMLAVPATAGGFREQNERSGGGHAAGPFLGETWRGSVGKRRVGATDRGAASVEFAIISVLLFTLLFGIVQYGYYFFQATAAEHAAREGARTAAIGIDDCTAWKALVKNRGGAADVVDSTVTGASNRGDSITVTVTWQRQNFGLPFVPFLGSGNQQETALTRAERVGTVQTGCS